MNGWSAFTKKNSPMKVAGDYDRETGQRLSKAEVDLLIEDEERRAAHRGVEPRPVSELVTSTYQDAIDRAETPEEKEAAEKKMAELMETEEGRALIEADAERTKLGEGETSFEGPNPVEDKYVMSSFPPPKGYVTETALVEGWSGEDAVDTLEEGESLKPEIKADIEAKEKAERDAYLQEKKDAKFTGYGDDGKYYIDGVPQ